MRVFDSRKLLTISVLLLIATLVVNGATSKETAVVKDVSFHPNGDSLEVKIATSEPTRFTYFELSNPHRLVVDFHGIRNAVGFKEKSIDTAGVARVRTSLFTSNNRNATRIVFDLAENIPYRVSDQGAGIVSLYFGTEKPGELKPSTQPAVLAAEVYEAPAQLRAPLTLTAGPPVIPEMAARPIPLISLLPPFLQIPVVQSAMSTRVSLNPVPDAPQAVPQVPPSLSATQVPSQYSGELVSIYGRDMDLKDFFSFLSEFTGLNIVLDPGVSGTIPVLSLNDVPWDQALDIVLKNHQLGSQLQGNVLRIATLSALQTEENTRKALRDAQDLSGDLVSKPYILNYTKADAVSLTLSRPGILSPRAQIIVDARRNALIVSDIPTYLAKADSLVKFLDTPNPQVEIEARLISANKSFSRELGSQLGFVIGNRSSNSISGVGSVGASPFIRTPPPSVNVGSAIPLAVNLPAAATSGLSFLLGTGADILLDEIITAAEARGTAKVISRPKVMTQNNAQAIVSQGTQIPVQSNQNNTVSVQYLNFSLKLTVTPQVTDAGTILMNIQIENSEPNFAVAVNGIPSVTTQQTTTQVMIPDGFTGVIGGILVDTDTLNIRQVPGLGSIPLIGHLFKHTAVAKRTLELLFFITPRIKPAETFVAAPLPDRPPGR